VSISKGANTGTSELKSKFIWTFLLLAVYRVGVHLPIPGVDGNALADFFANAQNTLFGLFDMFSGGGLMNLSIFALGIMPYISASIILQLLTVVSPDLKRLSKEEGAAGRKKITQYTRYGTVLISVIQGLGIAIGVESMTSPTGAAIVYMPGWGFRLINGSDPHGRDDIHHVAWREDHGEGDRQRHQPDHLRRHPSLAFPAALASRSVFSRRATCRCSPYCSF